MSKSKRAGVAAIAAFMLIAVMTACTSDDADKPPGAPTSAATAAPRTDPDDFLNADQMADEYRAAAASFPHDLPPGIEFPPQVPETYDPAAASEPGVGKSIANFYWICAWQAAFIDAQTVGDIAGQVAALDSLESWKSTRFYDEHYEDPQDLWSKLMLEPARAGDATELVAEFEAGCGAYRDQNPTP